MDFRAITRKQLYAALLMLVLIIGAIVLERAVVTDQERIERVINALRDAVGEADTEALFEDISEDYYDEALSREGLQGLAGAYFARYGRTRVRILDRTVNRTGTQAAVELDVFATAEHGSGAGRLGRSVWLVLLQKEPDGVWRVIRLSPLRWDGRDIEGWPTIRGAGGL